jgi:monothiol glutaredoxin
MIQQSSRRAVPRSDPLDRRAAGSVGSSGAIDEPGPRPDMSGPEGHPMPRAILDESKIHPDIRDKVATQNADIVQEVERAIGDNDVVVVGMAQNPHPRRACRRLRAEGIPFHYLEYGSYFGPWRRRNALKMWSGWGTFPMIFVKGTLIGGAADLARLLESGELVRLLGR